MKKQILFFILGGFVLASGLVVSAFTEPTTGPDSTTSYPPINLSKDTQIRTGSLSIGNGSSSSSGTGSLYVSKSLGSDSLTVRQNATLVGNVQVKGNMVVAGAVRVPQIIVGTPYSGNYSLMYSSTDIESSNQFTPSILMGFGSTTNLGRGNCQKVTNSACPAGYILSKYNPSTTVSSCRSINPVNTPTSQTSC